jgi:hypothetical protein
VLGEAYQVLEEHSFDSRAAIGEGSSSGSDVTATARSAARDDSDQAKLLADRLSYEVCDRLVLRERSALRRMRLIVAGLVTVGALAGAAGVYLYQTMR